MDTYENMMYEKFGKNIEILMKRENITEPQLAEKSHLNIGTIRGYVNNSSQPSFYAVLRIVYTLNSSITEVFDEVDKPIIRQNFTINKYVDKVINAFKCNLLDIRTKRNYSIDELANKVGLSPRALENYETVNSVPSLRAIFKICNRLELSIGDLFCCTN